MILLGYLTFLNSNLKYRKGHVNLACGKAYAESSCLRFLPPLWKFNSLLCSSISATNNDRVIELFALL